MNAADFEANHDPALLLDSGSLDDVRAAARNSLIAGVTTNPTLTTRALDSDAGHDIPALLDHARALIELAPGLVFVQPFSSDPDEALRQARQIASYDPQRVVIKLLAMRQFLAVATTLHGEDIRTALTAVFSPSQALVAHESGCDWVIPYVDRAARLGIGSDATVSALAGALGHLNGSPRILAASIKSPRQAIEAIEHGSHAISAPLNVLLDMADHPHSSAALEQFDLDLERFSSS